MGLWLLICTPTCHDNIFDKENACQKYQIILSATRHHTKLSKPVRWTRVKKFDQIDSPYIYFFCLFNNIFNLLHIINGRTRLLLIMPPG